MSGVAATVAGSWLERAVRRLEDDHRLLAGVLLVVLIALLAQATLSTVNKGKQDIDYAAVHIAGDMLGLHRPPSPQIGAPGYPLFLIAIAGVDPELKTAIACRADQGNCQTEGSFRSVVLIQFGLVIASLIMVFSLAWRLSGLWEAAVLSLLLTCLESRFGEFAAGISPYTLMTALTLLYSLLALEAYARRSPVLAFGAGAAAGGAALISPLTAAVIPALVVLLAFLRPNAGRGNGMVLAIACLGGALSLALLCTAALRLSYDSEATTRQLMLLLSDRAGFEEMRAVDWFAGLILPIPFIGGWLEFLFPDAAAERLAHGYTAIGIGRIFPAALNQPGSAFEQYVWLIKTYVADAFGSYLAVTPQILNRGIWGGGGIIAVLGMVSLKRLVRLHGVEDRLGALLIVFVPVAILVVTSVLASANQFTNVPLLPFVFAYAVAFVTACFPRDEEAAGAVESA